MISFYDCYVAKKTLVAKNNTMMFPKGHFIKTLSLSLSVPFQSYSRESRKRLVESYLLGLENTWVLGGGILKWLLYWEA